MFKVGDKVNLHPQMIALGWPAQELDHDLVGLYFADCHRRCHHMRIICLTAAVALAGILAFALGGSIAILAHGVPTVSHVVCTNPSN